MAEHHLIYHWRHGWIPLTHAAALSKAKGNSKLADKFVPGASRHHTDLATHGLSARQIHTRLGEHARVTARPATYQGVAGHNISGTDTRGRKVAVFVPGDRHAAQRAIDNIDKGRPAFHGHARSASAPSSSGAPTNEREAFKMGGADLRRHAANGSMVAQTELDRRAGKHGAAAPRKFNRPTAATPAKSTPKPAELPESKPATPKPAPAVGPDAHEQRKQASLARWESENRGITPAGYTVKSRVSSTEAGGVHMGLHTLYSSKDERVGSVLDRKNGRHLALYNGKQIGDREGYATRREAFAALADKHNAVTARESKKAETAARRSSRATAVGVFQPNVVTGDGTARGDAAAAKVKQSFTFKNHVVHIESAMSKEQTAAFLGDIHSVLLKSGQMDSEGITFHVPTGDTKFRQGRRNGVVGGYVRRGQRTIFVNPKVANGELTGFGGPNASDSLMAAAKQTTSRQYVITHELGHVLDNQHSHTHERQYLGASRVAYDHNRTDVNALHMGQRSNFSRYGQSNVAEGYAEAYAQWIHGGPGSSPAADAFAARFGWEAPKWYRTGGRK